MAEALPSFDDFKPGGALAAPPDPRPNLVGMDRAEIALALAELGVEPYRARQIHGWIYARGAVDFATMTNLSKDLRVRLAGPFRLDRPPPEQRRVGHECVSKGRSRV